MLLLICRIMVRITLSLFVVVVRFLGLLAESNIFQQLFKECKAEQFNNNTYKFNIWVLVPFDQQYKFSKSRVQPALDKALIDAVDDIQKLNSKGLFSALNRTTISIDYKDTKCNADTATKVATDIHDVSLLQTACNDTGSGQIDLDVIIGMSCDYAAGRVASLANHWNWPLIYPATRTHNFDEKVDSECCTTMVRPGITRSDFGDFVVEFFKLHQWNTSLIVYTTYNSHGAHVDSTTTTDCATAIGGVGDSFRAEGWSRYEYYDYISRNADEDLDNEIEDILKEIKNNVRVSVWCVGRQSMRRAMKAAAALNMTGGDFAFLYVDLYNSNTTYYWTDDDDNLEKDTSASTGDINITKPYTDDYLRALTVVTLSIPSNGSEYHEFSEYIKNKLALTSNGEIMEYNEYVNPFISLYYDAMMTFMYGIVKSFCNGSIDISNGEKFAEMLWGIEFESIGRNVTISRTGDRKMDYVIMDMNQESRKFEAVSIYHGVTATWETLNDIDWPYSNPPENIPECGYMNENCSGGKESNQTVKIAVIVLAVVLFFACIVVTVLFRKMKAENRLQKKNWKVRWEEIEWSRFRRSSSFCDSKESSHSIASSIASYHTFAGKQVFTKIGSYRGKIVAVKDIKRKRVVLDRSLLVELEEIYNIEENHICKFVGAVDDAPHGASILTEYCSRGSLQDFLEDNMEYEMKDFFKNSLISDIISGMCFLHRSFFKCHGNLKSSNCLIDNRFQLKLTDFGLAKLREGSRTDSVTGFKYYENKLWSAPEILRSLLAQGTPKADVYSFAIVVQEIIYRKGVFYTKAEHSPQEILYQLTCPPIEELPLRPTLDDGDYVIVDPRLRSLVQKCWSELPQDRPTFPEIEKEFKKLKQKKNLVDSLLERLDNYSTHLEEKVDERTKQYKSEKDRADSLLYQMLPQAVAEQLKKGNNVLPTAYDNVTIFFSDIVGFTAISHGSRPMQVVNMLNDLYTMFDQIIDKFDVYKVETIGDAYMVVSGLPEKNGNRHAREIARMALSLLDCVKHRFKISHMPNTQLKLRVGIHTGPVVAGVVGLKMPRYCLFGDTVNTASRMESNGKAFAIHVSPKTKEVLDVFETFILEEREEEVFLKGLGTWQTYWLKGEIQIESDSVASERSEEESEEIAKKPSPRFSRTNPTIVTFDSDSPIVTSNHLSAPKRFYSLKKSPPPIIKELQNIGPDSPMSTVSGPKRHRSGIVSSYKFSDGGLGLRERRAKISQLNMELINESEAEWQGSPSPGYKTGRKVQFDSYSQTVGVETPPVSIKNSKKCGRDSGIELGFDNPSCMDNLSSEDDYL